MPPLPKSRQALPISSSLKGSMDSISLRRITKEFTLLMMLMFCGLISYPKGAYKKVINKVTDNKDMGKINN